MATFFNHHGVYVPADAVSAVVQIDKNKVQIRYSDGKASVTLTDTTSSAVLAAIDAAKANADSP